MGIPPHEQDGLPWWLERFAIEGFGWQANTQREHADDHWPNFGPDPDRDELAELVALGVTVRQG